MISKKHAIVIRWIFNHTEIEENKVTDQVAKQVAEDEERKTVKWSSIAHVRRKGTKTLATEIKHWLQRRIDKRNARHDRFYTSLRRKRIDHTLTKALKSLTERFLQLKTEHAIVRIYLYKIKAAEDESCEWCEATRQSTHHVLLKCRKWRRKKNVLKKTLTKVNINWSTRSDEKWLTNLISMKKAMILLLEYLKNTKVERRKRTRKRNES